MSEEEKEAIAQLKKVIDNEYYTRMDVTLWNKCFKTLLNLIEKQQKEIQQLRNKLEFDYVEAHYIDKDKIREIIYSTNEDLEIILKIKKLLEENNDDN